MVKRRRTGRARAPHQGKTRRPRRRAGAPESPATAEASSPASALVDSERHRFPWPANPLQRYGLASPWLAVVNARGPWGVWQHRRKAPPWLPWCRSLWGKAWWRAADDGLKVFCWSVWQGAADEDCWGIVWGDPVRLCRAWGLDAAAFTARLDAMLAAGLVVYLTDAERDAAMAWRPVRRAEREEKKPEGERGSLEKKEGEGTGTGTEDRDSDRRQQIPDRIARANQIPDSREGQGQMTGTGTVTVKGTGHRHSPQPAEPANLPESDPQAGHGHERLPRDTEGPLKGHARPGSVSKDDAVRMGEVLAWSDPRAVAFGRAMYEAIRGRAAPPDLQSAHEQDRADVGVWVHYWFDAERMAIDAGRYGEFEQRCVRDTGKKRRVRGIRNLGAVVRARIVPGILEAMRGK